MSDELKPLNQCFTFEEYLGVVKENALPDYESDLALDIRIVEDMLRRIFDTRHLTRADIPESIVREIQAEALEVKGKEAHRAGSPLYMRHELDKSACIRAGNWLIIEAAKLREGG